LPFRTDTSFNVVSVVLLAVVEDDDVGEDDDAPNAIDVIEQKQ